MVSPQNRRERDMFVEPDNLTDRVWYAYLRVIKGLSRAAQSSLRSIEMAFDHYGRSIIYFDLTAFVVTMRLSSGGIPYKVELTDLTDIELPARIAKRRKPKCSQR